MGKPKAYKWLAIVVCFFCLFSTKAQNTPLINHDFLLLQLEDAIEEGNPRALRDLSSLVENEKLRPRIIKILQKNAFFPPEQISINNQTTRAELFDFLNQYENSIQYSPIIKAFYTRELEDYDIDYTIFRKKNLSGKEKSALLTKYIEIINLNLQEEVVPVFIEHTFQEIAALQTLESFQYLSNTLKDNQQELFFQEAICNALSQYNDPYVMDLLLDVTEAEKIPIDKANSLLFNYSNYELKADSHKELATLYRNALDTFGTLNQMRMKGFEEVSTLRKAYFEEDVDYFGYLLIQHYDEEHIRQNAIRGLLQSQHTRSLFYLSALLYAHYDNPFFEGEAIIDLFSNLINVNIKISDKDLNDTKLDKSFFKSYMIYWSQNYQHYTYRTDKRFFINQEFLEKREKEAEEIFKNLMSENRDTAFNAFEQLTAFEVEIIEKSKVKYAATLRRIHKELPDFQHGFLESISQLQEFCEIESYPIVISQELEELLNILKSEIPINQRYEFENQISQIITSDEITALEIDGLINSKNLDYNISVSRILDMFYSEFWKTHLTNQRQIRLYLKKSVLYSRIAAGGTSNRYIKKLPVNNDFINKLKQISLREYDQDISDAIAFFIDAEEEEKQAVQIPFQQFLDNWEDFDERNMTFLEQPNTSQIKYVYKTISKNKNVEKTLRFIDFLNYNVNEKHTPFLISLLDNYKIIYQDEKYTRKISDDALRLIESIYDYEMQTEENLDKEASAIEWKSIYQKQKDISKWHELLFERKIKSLENKEELTAQDINSLTSSDLINEEKIKRILYKLTSLSHPNECARLYFNSKLKASNHLEYFENIKYNVKYLDNILAYFETNESHLLLDYSFRFLAEHSEEVQGRIWTKLLDEEWVFNSILKQSDWKKKVFDAITFYYEEASYISEFEEKRIVKYLFLLENHELSLLEQLAKSKNYVDDKNLSASVQLSIMDNIELKDLVSILENETVLVETEENSMYQFIQKKFGFSQDIFQDANAKQQFIKDLNQLNSKDLYLKYLEIAGLELVNKQGVIDYNRVIQVLKHDISLPFSTALPYQRSLYTRGIVQLLSNTYEDVQFEVPSLQEQAEQWLVFLLEQENVNMTAFIPSFNQGLK